MCIGSLWIFEQLGPEEMRALVSATFRKNYKRGEAIFAQGNQAREMFLIKAGRVKLSKLAEDGTEFTLDIRQAGDFVGETMLSEEIEYPVTAWCLQDTLVCGFDKEGFERLVLAHPNIGLQVIRNLSRRIAWLTSRVDSFSATNLEDRLYRVLVNVAREHGVRSERGFVIQFPLTHEDLSFLVGAHRVSISRAMKELGQAGKIIQERKTYVIPYPSAT
ncbi:MAG: Crp/Fnr family transcriptional regulator [Chloroflexota bacterium]